MYRFEQLRKQNNKTQKEIADVLEMTRAGYGMVEQGRRELGFESLIKLADYYDVSIDYLLGRTSKVEINNEAIDLDGLVKKEAIKMIEDVLITLKQLN